MSAICLVFLVVWGLWVGFAGGGLGFGLRVTEIFQNTRARVTVTVRARITVFRISCSDIDKGVHTLHSQG